MSNKNFNILFVVLQNDTTTIGNFYKTKHTIKPLFFIAGWEYSFITAVTSSFEVHGSLHIPSFQNPVAYVYCSTDVS